MKVLFMGGPWDGRWEDRPDREGWCQVRSIRLPRMPFTPSSSDHPVAADIEHHNYVRAPFGSEGLSLYVIDTMKPEDVFPRLFRAYAHWTSTRDEAKR